MFNLGMPELIIIFIVALLVFGPKRLPELGKSLGRALHEFKRTTNEFKDNLETEVGTTKIKEELLNQQKEIQQSLAAAALKFAEEKPVETEEEYQAKAQTAEAEAAAAPQPGPPAPPAPETPDDEKPADPAVKAAPAAKADA